MNNARASRAHPAQNRRPLGWSTGRNVLDVGCGDEVDPRLVAEQVKSVVINIDIMPYTKCEEEGF